MDAPFNDSDLRLAVDALNRILAFNHQRNQQRDRLPHSSMLFHYTTAEGLKGIVETNELWASSAYFLNDSAEVTYGYGVLRQVLDEWLCSAAGGEDSLAMGLAYELKTGFEDHLQNKIVTRSIWRVSARAATL